jgi:hypothetical protein
MASMGCMLLQHNAAAQEIRPGRSGPVEAEPLIAPQGGLAQPMKPEAEGQ